MLERLLVGDAVSAQASVAPGCFHSPELRADARIVRGTGSDLELRLRGDYSGWRSLRMAPFSAGVFGLDGIDESSERYVLTMADGGAGGFVIDTYRARRVRFDRVAGAR